MKSFALTIRSIAAEFFSRLFIPITWSVTAVFVLLFAGTGWLLTQSAWWWILFVVLLLWALLIGGALLVAWAIIKRITPVRTIEQKKETKAFVDKAQTLAEVTGTPKGILLFRIVRDGMRPTEKSYLSSLANDSSTLHKDFINLKRSFEKERS